MKRIVILGSTGSIGVQTLDIVKRLAGEIEVVGLAAHSRVDELLQQADLFGARHVCVADSARYTELKKKAAGNFCTYSGVDGMCEISTLPEADMVVVSVAGAVGIRPTHAAISCGKEIALASKEVLVAAGEHTMRLAREKGVPILPIDSEHSALFQCLEGASAESVEQLLITASGGPFRHTPLEELRTVSPQQALKHPTWNMGGLVTINSSTLMNKGLEMIEARWLFDVPAEKIDIIVHPQSIIHSLVRYNDGSVLAQLGLPDMRLPIQYALVYPKRIDSGLPRMDLADIATLTFEKPDETRFSAIRLARHAIAGGGTLPAVMNAANEAAVDMFLKERIGYLQMMETVETVMQAHTPMEPTFENVLEADAWARRKAQEVTG
jgi:1-deoxy-D-xylulose-5-phosphate reductoisomerase